MEVAEFYGIWPVNEEQLLALHSALHRMEARRYRRALRLHPEIKLTWEGMYELVLAETGDEAQARAAGELFASRQMSRLDGSANQG